MNRDETTDLVALIRALFPSAFRGQTQDQVRATVSAWLAMLSDIHIDAAKDALKVWAARESFPPSIADIRKTVLELSRPEISDGASEAWAMLIKAIDAGPDAAGQYALPLSRIGMAGRIAAESVGLGVIIHGTTARSILFAQFREHYNAVTSSQRRQALMPPSMKPVIGQDARRIEGAA